MTSRLAIDRDQPVRRRPVPERTVDEQVVIARPADGTPIVLGPTATVIWSALDTWRRRDDLDRLLAQRWPDVDDEARWDALEKILVLLESEDVLERTAP